MTLEFDIKSDRVLVHQRPREGGGHGHADGSYRFEPGSGAVTVDAQLLGPDQPTVWSGRLEDGILRLGAADTRLEFRKGGKPHGH